MSRPQTWACVPNSCPVPLLAPALDARVCPLPAERWELCTRTFGCRVSSTTSLATLAAVLATLLVVASTALGLVALRRWRRYAALKPDWDQGSCRLWQPGWIVSPSRENQPLLRDRAGR